MADWNYTNDDIRITWTQSYDVLSMGIATKFKSRLKQISDTFWLLVNLQLISYCKIKKLMKLTKQWTT